MRFLHSIPLFVVALLLAITGSFHLRSTTSPVETSYYVLHGCGASPLLTVYEPIPRLLGRNFVQSRIVNGWNFRASPPPPIMPQWCVSWRARLSIPDPLPPEEDLATLLYPTPGSKFDLPFLQQITRQLQIYPPPEGRIRLVTLSKNHHEIRINPVAGGNHDPRESSLDLGPGAYDLYVALDSGDSGLSVPLALLTPSGSLFAVPPSWLAAPSADAAAALPSTGTTRLLWLALILAIAGTMRAVARRVPPRSDVLFTAVGIAGILVLAIDLRLGWLGEIPFFGETMDEFDLAWAGWGLQKYGVPFGWFFDDGPYSRGHVSQMFGEAFMIISPNLHRPPLYPLLVSMSGTVDPSLTMQEQRLGAIRLLPLLLSVLTIPLVYWIARRLGGRIAGWCAALFYATTPLIVLSNRLNKEDNLVAFLGALSIVLLLPRAGADPDTPRLKTAGAAVAAAAATISKLTGGAFIIAGAVLLTAERRLAHVPLFVVLALLLSLLAPLYGFVYGWELYLDMQRYLGTLAVGFSTLSDLLLSPRITNDLFGIGQYHWLWIAALLLPARASRWIGVPIALYAIALSCSVNSQRVYGWYLAPLFPLLCAGAGIAIARLMRAPKVIPLLIFFGLYVIPALTSIVSMETVMNRGLTRALFGVVAALLLGAVLLGGQLRSRLLTPLFLLGALIGTTSNLHFLVELPIYYSRYVQR